MWGYRLNRNKKNKTCNLVSTKSAPRVGDLLGKGAHDQTVLSALEFSIMDLESSCRGAPFLGSRDCWPLTAKRNNGVTGLCFSSSSCFFFFFLLIRWCSDLSCFLAYAVWCTSRGAASITLRRLVHELSGKST